MLAQLHPFRSHGVEPRRQVPRLGAVADSAARILKEYADIAEAEIVGEDENDVWFFRGAQTAGNDAAATNDDGKSARRDTKTKRCERGETHERWWCDAERREKI